MLHAATWLCTTMTATPPRQLLLLRLMQLPTTSQDKHAVHNATLNWCSPGAAGT